MMDHVIITAKAGVFIFYGVKAMGTAGYDFFYFIAIQHLNIGHGLHLEKKLIACTFCGVAGTAFFGAKYCEIHTDMLQDLTDITGDLLCAFIKTTCTTNMGSYLL
jgi:hypothetical protein